MRHLPCPGASDRLGPGPPICEGGIPGGLFKYWKEEGIVSGMWYGDKSRCYSYQLPPKNHSPPGAPRKWEGPQCPDPLACENAALDWGGDTHFAADDGYRVTGEESMKAEIFSKGPIAAFFYTAEDFDDYKSGVYVPHAPGMLATTVKILGWGWAARKHEIHVPRDAASADTPCTNL